MCKLAPVRFQLTRRNKHKDHWKPFDRKNPPPWMKVGAIGIDDKRGLHL